MNPYIPYSPTPLSLHFFIHYLGVPLRLGSFKQQPHSMIKSQINVPAISDSDTTKINKIKIIMKHVCETETEIWGVGKRQNMEEKKIKCPKPNSFSCFPIVIFVFSFYPHHPSSPLVSCLPLLFFFLFTFYLKIFHFIIYISKFYIHFSTLWAVNTFLSPNFNNHRSKIQHQTLKNGPYKYFRTIGRTLHDIIREWTS